MFNSKLVAFLIALWSVSAIHGAVPVEEEEQALIRGTPSEHSHRKLGFVDRLFGGNGGDSLCFGLFRDCEDEDDTSDTTDETNSTDTDTEDDEEEYQGIFGRPLFGGNGLFGCIFRDCEDEDGGDDGTSDGYVEGPFGWFRFPEDSVFGQLFDPNDGRNFLESIQDLYMSRTGGIIGNSWIRWADDVTITNTTCTNPADAPDCRASDGSIGLWVCRTLYNPYTGTAESDTQCIPEGRFIEETDTCGCCIPEGETAPVCPQNCPCVCDLGDGFDNGVRVNITVSLLSGETFEQQCVEPEFAVTVVNSMSNEFACITEC